MIEPAPSNQSPKPEPKQSMQLDMVPVVCSDYDADCLDMTHRQVVACYKGHPLCQLPQATGICPMLTRLN